MEWEGLCVLIKAFNNTTKIPATMEHPLGIINALSKYPRMCSFNNNCFVWTMYKTGGSNNCLDVMPGFLRIKHFNNENPLGKLNSGLKS